GFPSLVVTLPVTVTVPVWTRPGADASIAELTHTVNAMSASADATALIFDIFLTHFWSSFTARGNSQARGLYLYETLGYWVGSCRRRPVRPKKKPAPPKQC